MLFSSNRYPQRNESLDIHADHNKEGLCPIIEEGDHFKYLGVHLDRHLTFSDHCDKLAKKVRSRTFIMKRMRNFISEDLALSLYSTLIDPHLAYADVIYDGCTKTNSNILQVQQNMALRAVLNVDSRFSSQLLHDKTGIDWLDVTRKKRCCIEAYKGINGISPPSISNLFHVYVPGRSLRSSDKTNLVEHRTRTAFVDNNLVNCCQKYWKCLPDEIKMQPSLSGLKNLE